MFQNIIEQEETESRDKIQACPQFPLFPPVQILRKYVIWRQAKKKGIPSGQRLPDVRVLDPQMAVVAKDR
jgi:hypothetical protein